MIHFVPSIANFMLKFTFPRFIFFWPLLKFSGAPQGRCTSPFENHWYRSELCCLKALLCKCVPDVLVLQSVRLTFGSFGCLHTHACQVIWCKQIKMPDKVSYNPDCSLSSQPLWAHHTVFAVNPSSNFFTVLRGELKHDLSVPRPREREQTLGLKRNIGTSE